MQRFLWLILLIVFTIFIFFSSSLPATESAKMSGYVVKVLKATFEMVGMSYDGNLEYTIRKLAHFLEFGGQSWLLCKTYSEFYVSKRTAAGYILFFGFRGYQFFEECGRGYYGGRDNFDIFYVGL